MSRKSRKRLRKQRGQPKPKGNGLPLTNAEMRQLARYMNNIPRDKSNDNKIFHDENGDGCYQFGGRKSYCDHGWINGHCPYISEVGKRCLKWEGLC